MEVAENKEEIIKLQYSIITTSLTASILLECLDELKYNSSLYSNRLKVATKAVDIQITKSLKKQIDSIWKYNEIAASDLTNAIRGIAEHIAQLKLPSDIVNLNNELKLRKDERVKIIKK